MICKAVSLLRRVFCISFYILLNLVLLLQLFLELFLEAVIELLPEVSGRTAACKRYDDQDYCYAYSGKAYDNTCQCHSVTCFEAIGSCYLFLGQETER